MSFRPTYRTAALAAALTAALTAALAACDRPVGNGAAAAAKRAADSAAIADAAAAARSAAAARVTDSIAHLVATVRPQRVARPVAAHSGLSPLADTIAAALVFAPRTETWFAAAARGKRMLVDIGRVDAEVRKDPARKQAYREAVTKLSRIREGARFRLHGPWGAEDVTVTGFDTWNGRIVAVLRLSPRVDSLARTVDPLPAAAKLLAVDSASYVAFLRRQAAADDSAAYAALDTTKPLAPAAAVVAPAPPPCVRDSAMSPALADRALLVRDSLEADLYMTAMPTSPGLLARVVVKHTQVAGCFGPGRVLLVASLRAGDMEHVRERFVLLDTAGTVRALDVKDLRYHRFRAHEAIAVLDADDDGMDDLAVRGLGERLGGTAILRLIDGAKLVRLTSGFAWESR